ncbi:hypothetical protein F4678DRAFT_154415 [Xylaria arbuscula]|nr:hypothetical protein F4678DRAFT_154415 [Xylaria arbuscula]
MTANKERVRRQVVLSAIPVPRVRWRSRLKSPGQDAESAKPFEGFSTCWQLGRTPAALVKIPASGTLGPRPSAKRHATAWDLLHSGRVRILQSY